MTPLQETIQSTHDIKMFECGCVYYHEGSHKNKLCEIHEKERDDLWDKINKNNDRILEKIHNEESSGSWFYNELGEYRVKYRYK